MEPLLKQPHQCSPQDLDAFEHLIIEGGEVSPVGLRRRIEAAEHLIFVGNDPLLAVGAVKNPNASYKQAVFAKAGVADQCADFTYELGWFYASPDARGQGVGNMLMKAALGAAGEGGMFATTRADNDAMHYLLGKFSFKKLGSEYPSKAGDYKLVLYAYRPWEFIEPRVGNGI
jgi:GNAT superfamily N-acetyltransferase